MRCFRILIPKRNADYAEGSIHRGYLAEKDHWKSKNIDHLNRIGMNLHFLQFLWMMVKLLTPTSKKYRAHSKCELNSNVISFLYESFFKNGEKWIFHHFRFGCLCKRKRKPLPNPLSIGQFDFQFTQQFSKWKKKEEKNYSMTRWIVNWADQPRPRINHIDLCYMFSMF